MNQKEKEVKSKLRLDVNRTLLAISFTVFALIISINPSLLKNSLIVSLQLTISIPLFLSSIFARSKLAHAKEINLWENYGFVTFLVGYAFLINVVGNLLSISAGIFLGLAFFGVNMVLPIVYSCIEVKENKYKFWSRFRKDFIFILLIVLGGVLPSLGIY